MTMKRRSLLLVLPRDGNCTSDPGIKYFDKRLGKTGLNEAENGSEMKKGCFA